MQLPAIAEEKLDHLDHITHQMGVPRSILASSEEIQEAWYNIPKYLRKMDPDLRDAQIVKMCVAISDGLFDGAINYCWNSAVSALRKKVINFGLDVVRQIKGDDFDENKLNELRDAQLIDLCYELELIDTEGYTLLNQCRDIRNSFSAAHPSIASLDESEVTNFINRCAKYAMTNSAPHRGVDVQTLLRRIKDEKLTDD